MGNRGDPKQAHLFRVSLAGGAMEQITKGEGYVQRGSNAQSSWSVGRSDVLSPCRALPLAVHTWSRSRVASIASSTVTTPRRSQWWCASATLPTALCSECFMTARLSQVHLARTKRSKVPGQAQLLRHRVKASVRLATVSPSYILNVGLTEPPPLRATRFDPPAASFASAKVCLLPLDGWSCRAACSPVSPIAR